MKVAALLALLTLPTSALAAPHARPLAEREGPAIERTPAQARGTSILGRRHTPPRASRPLAIPGNAPPPRTGPAPSQPRPAAPPPRPAPQPAAPAPQPTPPPSQPAAPPPAPPPQPAALQPYQVRPYHGVVVYGPRPAYHPYYQAPAAPTEVAPPPVQDAHLPKRKVDRARTLSVGLTVGSLIAGYKGGSVFGDFGLGLQTRYRPSEAFALELGAAHYNESFGADTERARTSGSVSAMLFLTPWARLSPYVLGGLTLTGVHRDLNLPLDLDPADGGAKALHFGPHGGLGLEIAIGQRFALDLDARLVGYVTRGEDRVSPIGAFTTNLALVTFF